MGRMAACEHGEYWGDTHVTGRPCWWAFASVAAVAFDIRGKTRSGTSVIQRTNRCHEKGEGGWGREKEERE